MNKYRMNKELSSFAARLRESICSGFHNQDFDASALALFALQFESNAAYRKVCEACGHTPDTIEHWTQIPAVPTSAFKELEFSCIPPEQRTAVFHSSGTTEQKPSRHFHNEESLAVYEASLWSWFEKNALTDLRGVENSAIHGPQSAIFLAPPSAQAPHSSLVHMFETVRQKLGGNESIYAGKLANDGGWTLDFNAVIGLLNGGSIPQHEPSPPHEPRNLLRPPCPVPLHSHRMGAKRKQQALISGLVAVHPTKSASRLYKGADCDSPSPGGEGRGEVGKSTPIFILGTAFSFVHLSDFMKENNLHIQLPEGSRVMETGGYKNRSRSLPKSELHALITECLGVSRENIICEYGMSELSSQAYDSEVHPASSILHPRVFHFPPWARVQIISPETGGEVADGDTGLIRVFDLANVFSVMAIQTEDLGIRRGDGFELIGRALQAEPRGCSLMNVDALTH